MGCAGGKQGKPQEVKRHESKDNAVPEKVAASEVAQLPAKNTLNASPKLTLDQIEQKRQRMREDLGEGHSQPPAITFPQIGMANVNL